MIEITAVVIAVVVVAISVLILLAFLLYGSRESSFDDVIKQGRGVGLLLQDEINRKGHHVIKDKKEKKKKGKLEKEKEPEKSDSEHDSVDKKQHEDQQAPVRRTVLQSSESHTPALDVGKIEEPENGQIVDVVDSKKHKKAKVNQEKFSERGAGSALPKHDEHEDTAKPDVAVDLVKSAEDNKKNDGDSKKSKKKSKHKREAVVEGSSHANSGDDVHTLHTDQTDMAQQLGTCAANGMPQSSGTTASLDHVFSDVDLETLVEQVRRAHFSDAQLVRLVGDLQAKQPKLAGSSKDVAALNKKLEEKEQQLTTERQNNHAVQQKVKELRQELDTAKTQYASVERSYREQMQQKQNEYQQLHHQAQDMQAGYSKQLKECQEKFISMRQTLEQTNPQLVQQLRDENLRQKERIARADVDHGRLNGEIQRLNAELVSRDRHISSLENNRVKLDMELRQRDARLKEHGHAPGASDAEAKLQKDLTTLQGELQQAKAEVTGLLEQRAKLEAELTSTRKLYARQDGDIGLLQEHQMQHLPVQNGLERHGNADAADHKAFVKEVEKLRTEVLALKQSSERIFNELSAANVAKSDAERRLHTAEHELAELRKAASSRDGTHDVVSLIQRVETLERERDALLHDHGKVQQEAIAKSHDNEQRTQSLEHHVAQLQAALQDATAQRDVLASKQNSLLSDSAKVNDSAKHLEQKLVEVRNEVDQLKTKCAALEREKSALLDRDGTVEEARHKELEKTMNAKNTLEAEIVQLKAALDAVSQKQRDSESSLSDAQTKLREAAKRCEELESENSQKEAALESAINARNMAERTVESLRADANNKSTLSMAQQEDTHAEQKLELSVLREERQTLADKVAVLESTLIGRDKVVTKLELDIKDLKKKCNEGDLSSAEMLKEVDRLHELSTSYSQQLQDLRNQNAKLRDQIGAASMNGFGESNDETGGAKERDGLLVKLNQQVIAKDNDLAKLALELQKQKKKNAELREKNYKVLEAASQVDKVAQEVAKRTVHDVEVKYKNEMDEQRKLTQQLLNKAFPEFSVPPTNSYKEWLQAFETVVKRHGMPKYAPSATTHSESASPRSELPGQKDPDLKMHCARLDSEKKELESQISNYKSVLRQTEALLQKLESGMDTTEQDLLRKRCAALEAELDKIRGESVASEGSRQTSMQQAQQQLNAAQDRLLIEEKEKNQLKEDVARLNSELLHERRTGKDLSAQAVKLRGMVKVGQDALKTQLDVVEDLKARLNTSQVNNSGAQPEDWKRKCAEVEQKLERQLNINKQLLHKLETSSGHGNAGM